MTRLTAPALIFAAPALVLAAPAYADETRQLDAHVHGIGEFNMAIEGGTVEIELHAPGFDIVGFEHAAESDADRAAIQAALGTLAAPLDLFVMPAAAGCTATRTSVALETEEEHAEHDHDDDHDHDHAEEAAAEEHDHAEHDHDHGAEKTEEAAHDHDHDHDHSAEKTAEAAHDHDHDHDHGAEAEASHTEFHAEYTLTCADPSAIGSVTFAYFDAFSGAEALEVQVVTAAGAQGFDVTRAAPVLTLTGL
ncbi:MAG: DUF2796 domain-containing protein [Pseudomonadota bacterium]